METGHAPSSRLGRYLRLAEVVGGHRNAVWVRLRLSVARVANRFLGRPWPAEINMPVRGIQRGLALRTGTSDLPLFDEIFLGGEFHWARTLPPVKTIMDCGANIGYVSAGLLRVFPDARVVAIEPDPSNVAMYKKNLAPFGDRATVVQAGIWPKSTGLKIVRFEAESMWGLQVRECEPGEAPDVHAKSIPELMAEHGMERIGLLKLDIEGSEKPLFTGDLSWLDRVDNLSIELHGGDTGNNFAKAMQQYDYTESRSGALIVCTNLRRKASSRA